MSARGGILALDVASATGWAWRARGMSLPEYGLWKLGGPRGFARMFDLLDGFLDERAPMLVAFESPLLRHSGGAAARKLLGLLGVVEAVCARRGVSCREQHRQTVMRLVLGRGNADKDAVLAWARGHGLEPETHDVADALALLRYSETFHRHLVTGRAAA